MLSYFQIGPVVFNKKIFFNVFPFNCHGNKNIERGSPKDNPYDV